MSGAPSGYVVCPNCRRPNPANRTVCWGCHKPLRAEATAAAPAATPAPASTSPPPSQYPPTPPARASTLPPPRSAASPRTGSSYRAPRRLPPGPSEEGPRRRLRKGPLVIAILLIVVSLILFGISAAANQPLTQDVKSGSAWVITPQTLNPLTLTVSWNTSTGAGHVYLMTGQPTCTKPSGVVVNATGGHGTFSHTVNPGKSYNIYACGTMGYISSNFTVSESGGFSWLDLLGTVLIVIGLLFLVLAFIPRRHDPFEI